MEQDGRWQEPWVVPPQASAMPFTGVCAGLGLAASRHAHHLGLGVRALHARQLTWMLSRLVVHLARPVAPCESLQVVTWPSGVQRLFALREFELRGGDGARLGAGRSSWFLIDLGERRPIDPAPHVAHLRVAEPVLDARLDRVGEPFDTRLSQAVAVAPSDIDVNRHVTFTSYIGWIERAAAAALGGRGLLQMEINYLAEVFEGDAIRVDVGPTHADDRLWIAHVVRGADDPVAKARLRCA